jgi:hypothetical protein
VDSIFMMPQLGVAAQVHPKAAMEVFERDCLIYLGTCIAAKGHGKPGKPAFSYTIEGEALTESGQIKYGELKLLPLGMDDWVTVTVEPTKNFDMGNGPGKRVQKKARGGTVGLVLDGRGRPLQLPEDPGQCRQTIEKWITAMDMYAEQAVAV